jgi:disulfide bond formation protein DsbB
MIDSKRMLPLGGCLAVVVLLSAAYYLEYVEGILPCPLCMLQRGFFFLIGSVFLIAFLCRFSMKGQKICGGSVFILALGGMFAAIRQLWLQAQPPASGEICAPGFQYMIKNISLKRILDYLLSGSGSCFEVSWTLLGLSLAAWALIAFIGFACLGLYLARKV